MGNSGFGRRPPGALPRQRPCILRSARKSFGVRDFKVSGFGGLSPPALRFPQALRAGEADSFPPQRSRVSRPTAWGVDFQVSGAKMKRRGFKGKEGEKGF